MAYSGYLVRVGDYKIPLEYMQEESYTITRNTQDLDSYNDADGLLHRNALSLVCDKLEFNTPYMKDTDMDTMFAKFRENYTSQIERKASVRVYVPEMGGYTTQDMYFVNPEVNIYHADSDGIIYAPTRICFIGYGVAES